MAADSGRGVRNSFSLGGREPITMGHTTELRRAIRRNFVPEMSRKGFVVDDRAMPMFLTFRRGAADKVHVCDIQWYKRGRPRFVVNFGSCGPEGVICHGQSVNATDMLPSQVSVAGRLSPRPGGLTRSWFRQDRSWLASLFLQSRLLPAEEVAEELLRLFPEVERYWSTGSLGVHMRMLARRWWSRDRTDPDTCEGRGG